MQHNEPITLWSDAAWRAGERSFNEILRLPFITELAAGTLSRERFMRYIAQDSLYLAQYCKVLSHIAARVEHADMRSAFLGFAADGVAVEEALHGSLLAAPTDRTDTMSPACLFYTSLLKSTAYEPVEVEAAAILPCFWIYREVGKWITRNQSRDDNPYADWIATYSDPGFDRSTDVAISICNRLAHGASSAVRTRMTEIYAECSRMEWLFWHSAYTNLHYPVEI